MIFFKKQVFNRTLDLEKSKSLSGILLIMAVLFLNCSFIKPILFPHKTTSPKSLALSMELTDTIQKEAGYYLGAELSGKFLDFSEIDKRFYVVKPGDKADYTFKIRITSLRLISINDQASANRNQNNYLETHHRKMPGKRYSEGTIAAHTPPWVALSPLGFFGMAIVSETFNSMSTAHAQNRINFFYATANLGYQAVLLNDRGKIRWKKNGYENFNLYHIVPEKEQLTILVRNVVLKLSDYLPYYQIN
jgi:hypothetical protein